MITSNTLRALINSIILHQQAIIGPLAIDQARKVQGLTIQNSSPLAVEVKTTDPASLLTNLVKKYEDLFGQTSVEVCKDAILESGTPVSNKDLPEILQ